MANNEYGLDTHYFKKNLKLLVRDIDRYTPEEMATALGRLSDTARPLSRSPGCSTHVGWVLTADDGVVRGFVWADEPSEKSKLELQKRHLIETGSDDAKVFAVYER